MRNTEVDGLSMYKSAEKTINERIEKLQERLEKNKEKLKEKVGFIDKMSINSANKSYEEEIRKLTELNKIMGELHYSENNKYNFPQEVIEGFNNLGSLLTDEEINELRNTVNSCLRNANKDKKDKIKNFSIEVQKLLNKLKLSDKAFLVYDGLEYKKSITYENATKKMEQELLENLIAEYVPIRKNERKNLLPNNEKLMISKIEEMIINKELEQSKNVNAIVSNISEIKEAMEIRERSNNLLLIASNTLTELNNINEIDVSMIKNFINKIADKYKKELEKANKYLSSFDFTDIKKQIDTKKEKEEQEQIKNNNIVIYENLAYDLEKALTEESNNYQKIREIEAKMKEIVDQTGLTLDQIEHAKTNGKTKYHRDIKSQQAKVTAAKEKIAYEDELRKTVMAEIREEAIRELEASKAFEGSYETRNGDIYSQPIDREALIQRKIEELKKLADMTPEERGLYDLKKMGIVKSNATINDLTMQQLNDIRLGYSDNAYSFMADYKDWKAREEAKPKADNIYKEYIKYRSSLKDKNEFLSFSDYAKQVHKIENMTDTMVNEELKEEMRETMQEQGGRGK